MAGGHGEPLHDGKGSNGKGDGGGSYTLAQDTATNVTKELQALQFTPAAAAPDSVDTVTTFTLSDTTTAGTSATNIGTSVDDSHPAVAPTVTGGKPNQQTTSEATVDGVFQGVAVTDPNDGKLSETVTITAGGSGGTLSGPVAQGTTTAGQDNTTSTTTS